MKLKDIREGNDKMINESWKQIHKDLDQVFDWLKDLKASKDVSDGEKRKIDWIKGRLDNVKKDTPTSNTDLAKKIIGGVIRFPYKVLTGSK